ncbi:MAG: phospholipid carrier-dependent glycosyltransferase [Chloroflexi bacterium]|nr:phospholipid carrier-dependent glycosyltransferase [Chloroflexota bacterium]
MITSKDFYLAIALFCVLAFWLLLTSGGHIDSTDGETAYQTTAALAERGTFKLLPAEQAGDTPRSVRVTERGIFGITGPLQSLMGVPFYWAGQWIAARFPPPFSEYFTRFTTVTLNAFLHALTSSLLYVFSVDLGYRRRTALFTALAFALATLAWPYSRTFFADTGLTFWLVVTTWFLWRYFSTGNLLWVVGSGMAMGLGVANKYVMFASAPAFAGYLGLKLYRIKCWERQWKVIRRLLIVGGISIFLVALCIFTFNYLRFDNLLETGYTTSGGPLETALRKTSAARPLISLYGFIFSSGKGFFFFSPPALLALWGIKASASRHKDETWLFLALAISYPLFYALTKRAWYGGSTWGPRHILCITPFLLLLAEAFIARRDLPRWWRAGCAIVLFVIGFWAQLSVTFVHYNAHLLGDRQFVDQLYHPEDSALAAQWYRWPPQWRRWRAYDHPLRASGDPFYTLEGDLYAIEVADMAPVGRWMAGAARLRLYVRPETDLTIRLTYSRPRAADAEGAGWAGLHLTYDGAPLTAERLLLAETAQETQWVESVTLPADAVYIFPGTLEFTATTWTPHALGDPRDLGVFLAGVDVVSDGYPVPYRDAHLPRPLPFRPGQRWSQAAMLWFYDPANARPSDLWPWYIWTIGLPLEQARVFIISYGGLLLAGFLASVVWCARAFNHALQSEPRHLTHANA